MFNQFFYSELRYNLRQPMVYLFFSIVFLLVFAASSSDNVQIGGSVGNVFRNAPHIVTVYTSIMTVFGLLFAVAFFNNAALRDHQHNFNEILYTTPLDKFGYFFGRFCAALLLATVPLVAVFVGISLGALIAPLAGWVEPERIGELQFSVFLNNYLLFVLPNMLFAGSIIYWLAHQFRSTVVSFVGALLIIVAYSVSGRFLSDLDNETLGALVDIFGIRTYSVVSKYYTPLEKNTLGPSFSGLLLWNRLIWIGASIVLLSVSYIRFSFSLRASKFKKEVQNKTANINVVSRPKKISYTLSKSKQFLSFFKINFISIYKHNTFKILFLFSLILLLADLISGFEYLGLQSYPLTYRMTDAISGTSLFVMIVLVFFSGELIWRDRDHHINEVIDASPFPNIISLFAKTLSLFSITLILHLFFVLTAIIFQFLKGFTQIELSTYLGDFFYNSLPLYLVSCVLLIAFHVIINNKYIAYLVSVLIVLGLDIIFSILDLQSNMLYYLGSPYLIYSDMNGFGPSQKGVVWFNFYWLLTALFLLLISSRVWVRGNAKTIKERIRSKGIKSTGAYWILTSITGFVWLGVASYVYYNSQVLNPYKSRKEAEEVAASYEKKYKKYKDASHPKIVSAEYDIALYPNKKEANIKALFEVINPYDTPIDTLLFNVSDSWDEEIVFPNATLVRKDEEHQVLYYAFDPPFQKGDTLKAEIKSSYRTKGFANGSASTGIVKNGSFLNNFEMLPSIGYDESKILSDRNKRRKYELPPKERMPKLEEFCTENCLKNYLTDGYSDYIPVKTRISTVKGQIAIAPGSLQKEWTEGERTYYEYEVDHPSQNFYSFISADFEVAKRDWNDVSIEIYHDAKHQVNIEKMLDAVERSLKYYTANFGPYMHKQCRIIEFPRFSTFAQAFPGTMPYSEAFGFVIDLEGEDKNNVIDAVIAHEMAHQWWAHQVVGANMQGGTLLSESFSEYASLMTMKSISKTPMEMREYLKYDHDRYLRGRAREVEKELPLYKVENQSYIHYGKGSVVLYALQDYIGEANVNDAMREFLEDYRYTTPYPTSLDFLEYLTPKVPDSLHYLITDWFKEITLYDNRLKEAIAIQNEAGKYEVTLQFESRKIKADSIGNESSVALNEWIDIGLFADVDEKILMHQERVHITDEKNQVTLVVDSIPVKAAIDPRHLLIDRVYDDNTKSVQIE